MGKIIKKYRFLIALEAVFCAISVIIIMQAWEGLLTLFWHGSKSFEHLSVALNYPNYGILYPYSEFYRTLLHLPPLYSWLTFFAIKLTGWIKVAQIVSLVFGALTLVAIYKICEILAFPKEISLISSLLLATSPLFLLLSSSIMQETTMLFFSTVSIMLLAEYLKRGSNFYLFLSGFTVFLSAFSNWQGIFTLIPFFFCLLQKERLNAFKNLSFYFVMLFPIILSSIWFFHIWSITGSGTLEKITGHLFYSLTISFFLSNLTVVAKTWILYVPVTTLIFLILGLSRTIKDRYFLLLSWLGSGILFYLLFLTSVNTIHYTALGLPSFSIIGALGVSRLSNRLSELLKEQISSKHIMTVLGLVLLSIVIMGSIFYPQSSFLAKKRQKALEAKEIDMYIQEIKESKDKIGLVGCPGLACFFALKININKIEFLKNFQLIRSISRKPKILIVDRSRFPLKKLENIPFYQKLKDFEYYSIYRRKNSEKFHYV